MRRSKLRTGFVWGWIALVALATVGMVAFVDSAAAAPNLGRGAVFVATNDPGGNSILVFRRNPSGRPSEGSASSYEIADDGTPTVISGMVGSGQIATCWVVIAGPYAYMTNTASGTISRYRVMTDGKLTLQQSVAATTGGNPIDMALSPGDEFLYALVDGAGMINIYRVGDNGNLTLVNSVSVPPFSQGIVTF